MTKVMISCGEASGDLYAGALTTEIRRLDPGAEVFGLGGERLQQSGARLVADYRGLAVTGLAEALSVLPRSFATYRQLVAAARRERPDVLVVIDFPDFNFRLAAAVRRLGVPVVYYIGPQVWAWRRGRLNAIKRLVTKAIVIFPFEEPIYREAGIPVEFVGHPLIDLARPASSREQFLQELGVDPAAPTVALLPGSRPNELRAILPDLGRAAAAIAAQIPAAQFVVARAPNLADELFRPLDALAGRLARPLRIVEARTNEVLAASDVVLTASGTATVQTAIQGRPMIIVYRLSPLTYRLGRRFVRIDTFGMVNLVAGERIVPELIQDAFTPEAVAGEALSLLRDRERARHTTEALRRVREKLGAPGASRRAAESILAIARRSNDASLQRHESRLPR